MKKFLRVMMILALTIIVGMGAGKMNASAKQVTSKSPIGSNKIAAATTKAKAKSVKTKKAYTVYTKTNKHVYFKFVAPSKGTYKFKFSNLAVCGYSTSDSKCSQMSGYVATSNYSVDKFFQSKACDDRDYPTSTSFKLKLKKNQKVYIVSYFDGNPFSYTLKITK